MSFQLFFIKCWGYLLLSDELEEGGKIEDQMEKMTEKDYFMDFIPLALHFLDIEEIG